MLGPQNSIPLPRDSRESYESKTTEAVDNISPKSGFLQVSILFSDEPIYEAKSFYY
jgi:hypothetical protein